MKIKKDLRLCCNKLNLWEGGQPTSIIYVSSFTNFYAILLISRAFEMLLGFETISYECISMKAKRKRSKRQPNKNRNSTSCYDKIKYDQTKPKQPNKPTKIKTEICQYVRILLRKRQPDIKLRQTIIKKCAIIECKSCRLTVLSKLNK